MVSSPCAEAAALGAGVEVLCVRFDGHPMPHEAPVVTAGGFAGRLVWGHWSCHGPRLDDVGETSAA